MTQQRCKHIEKDGFHTCGSYAFNLWKDGIEQGDLCDVHYWQDRAQRAEALTAPVQEEDLYDLAVKADNGGQP
jgi:hypothetical protein